MIVWIALFSWPLVCIALFRNLSLPVALCVSVIGGYLLLPSGTQYDIPFLPPLHKDNIPALAALLMMAVVLQQKTPSGVVLRGVLPKSRLALFFLCLWFFGIFGTVLTNGEMLFYGPTVLIGMSLYDGLSMAIRSLLIVLPLLLARKVLASPEGQRALLLTLMISGLIYCVPVLYEVRMSPQLHINIYGFYPHSFLQSFRGGGFRPSVFLTHGLELSMFLVATLLAAAGLYRAADVDARLRLFVVVVFLLAVLILANSLGALVIALLVLPVALLAKQRTQVIFAACIAMTVLSYPLLRNTGLIPTETIVSAARLVDPVRAGSLGFRFEHEDALLAKANLKPIFGWGEWGRNRVHNEYGRDVSVIDGAWVAAYTVGGWARYLAFFGLLCWPIIGLLFTRRQNLDPICIALALILAAKLLDLIPNGAVPPFIWLVAGSLLGRLEMRVDSWETPEERSELGYSRRRPAVDGSAYARTFRNERSARAKPKRVPRRSLHYRSLSPPR